MTSPSIYRVNKVTDPGKCDLLPVLSVYSVDKNRDLGFM